MWSEFGWRKSEPCSFFFVLVLVVYREGSQASYQAWCCLPCPDAFQKERRVRRGMLFLLTRVSLKITNERLSLCFHQAKHWNLWKNCNISDLTSRCKYYAKDMDIEDIKADRRCWLWWRAVHLDYVMAAGYKKIYTTWCWNRCQPSALPLCFPLQSRKWVTGPSWWNAHITSPPTAPPPKNILWFNSFNLLLWSKPTGKLRKTKHFVNLFKDEHIKTASPSVLLSRDTRVGNNNFDKSCTHEPRLTPPTMLSYTWQPAQVSWGVGCMYDTTVRLDRIPRGCVG